MRFYPETGCEAIAARLPSNDHTPVANPAFTLREDASGVYLYGEHIDGDVYLLMGHRQK